MRVLATIAVAAALGSSPAAAEQEPVRRLLVPSIAELAQHAAVRRAHLRQPTNQNEPLTESEKKAVDWAKSAAVQAATVRASTKQQAAAAESSDAQQGNDADEDAEDGPDQVQVLEQEVKDLKIRAVSLEDDKKALVNTVQEVMRTNQTMELKRQLTDLAHMKDALEMRCGKEVKELQAKVNETVKGCDTRVQAVRDDQDSNHEVMQALREQNMELQDSVTQLQAELLALKKENKVIASDRDDLMKSLHSLLRKQVAATAKPAAPKPAPVVRHEKKPRSHHRRKHGNGTNTSAPIDWDDPVQVMGETKDISDYLAKVSESQAMEKAAAEGEAKNKNKKVLWSDDGTVSELDSKDEPLNAKAAQSPMDLLAPPTTTPAAPSAAAESDDGVAALLKEAEDSAGGVTDDDSADPAADQGAQDDSLAQES